MPTLNQNSNNRPGKRKNKTFAQKLSRAIRGTLAEIREARELEQRAKIKVNTPTKTHKQPARHPRRFKINFRKIKIPRDVAVYTTLLLVTTSILGAKVSAENYNNEEIDNKLNGTSHNVAVYDDSMPTLPERNAPI
ncbi:MAG: hypothetical protein LBM38_01520 [Clostridiales bacterium]|jgi:hypothetical protein|nr:hypothetical protein [Clostridiales bacterium]